MKTTSKMTKAQVIAVTKYNTMPHEQTVPETYINVDIDDNGIVIDSIIAQLKINLPVK